MSDNETQTPLEAVREEMGFTSRSVARVIGLDPSGFLRIERGTYTPRKDIADRIYQFYDGIVPLGMIFDARHEIYRDWLTPTKRTRLRRLAARRAKENEELRARATRRPAR